MYTTSEHWQNPWRYWDQLEGMYQKTPSEGKIVFYGSSTFAFWKNLANDIHYPVENHGFGGSVSDEALYHYNKLVVEYKPKALVWYFGDNDFVCNYSVDESEYLTHKTWSCIRTHFPDMPIIILGTKICPNRHEYVSQVTELNKRLKEFADNTPNYYFVDTTDICKANGEYILENFIEDQLHFSQKGYDLVAKKLNPILDTLNI